MSHKTRFGYFLKPKSIILSIGFIFIILSIAYISVFVSEKNSSYPPFEIDQHIPSFSQVKKFSEWEAETDSPLPALITRVIKIKKGDNLMGVLIQAGIKRTAAHSAIQSLKSIYDPRRNLNIGDKLQITLYPKEKNKKNTDAVIYFLNSLIIPISYNLLIEVKRNEKGEYEVSKNKRNIQKKIIVKSGKINSSLFVDGNRIGIPQKVLAELIRIYSFDIDFQRDIWQGDTFELMYDQFLTEYGDIVHEGDIQYAKITLRNIEIPLYKYTTNKGNIDYFNTKGKSVRKTLMRTPIDGARLSSRFGKRKHPILGYTRIHAGVDFAAPHGTPIYAAGNGSIIRIGRNGGYGKYIRIRHNGTYQTAYAHLSNYARGMRKGKRLKQGQIIGYVGSTGVSTGPHLHYEVLRNGKKINPRSVKIPSGENLKGTELNNFINLRKKIDSKFFLLSRIN
tara:strand:- start:123 stop:1469 length:1347 start_codon:yes stop_codon:yes gene_type:complete